MAFKFIVVLACALAVSTAGPIDASGHLTYTDNHHHYQQPEHQYGVSHEPQHHQQYEHQAPQPQHYQPIQEQQYHHQHQEKYVAPIVHEKYVAPAVHQKTIEYIAPAVHEKTIQYVAPAVHQKTIQYVAPAVHQKTIQYNAPAVHQPSVYYQTPNHHSAPATPSHTLVYTATKPKAVSYAPAVYEHSHQTAEHTQYVHEAPKTVHYQQSSPVVHQHAANHLTSDSVHQHTSTTTSAPVVNHHEYQHAAPVQHQYVQQPAVHQQYSHQAPVAHKPVHYSPAEAVSHTSFHSGDAKYSW